MSWTPDGEGGGGGGGVGGGGGRGRKGGATFSQVFDVTYLRSLAGLLLLTQATCCFLGFVLGVAWRGQRGAGHGFFLFVMFCVLLCSLALLVCRAIKLDDLLDRNIDWTLVNTAYSGVAAVLVLVGSCVMVEVARAVSSLKAAGVFGLLAWTALLASFLLHGQLLWQQRRGGLPTTTATLTTAPSRHHPSDVHDEESDEWSDDEGGQNDEHNDGGGGEVTLTRSTLRPPSPHITATA